MINFKRASTATYINKQGVLTVAQANEPRFEEKGILIEGRSTNLLPFSVDMTKSKQTNVHSISNSNEPFLGGFAQLVEFKPVKDARIEYPLANSIITFSVWIKGTKGEVVDIRAFEGTPNNVLHTFTGDWDLVKTTTPQSPVNKNVWCAILQPTEKALTPFYVGCVQAESLPFASSYIPTNGTAVTRGSDNLHLTDFSLSSGMSFFAEWHPAAYSEGGNANRLFDISASGDYDLAYIGLNNLGNVLGRFSNGGNGVSSFGYPFCKIAMVGSLGSRTALYVDSSPYEFGSIVTKDIGISNQAKIYIGSNENGQGHTFGYIKNVKIWKTALTPEQVSTL